MRSQKWWLCSEHTAAGCAHMHADSDGDNDGLIQIDIDSHTRRIPHAWGLTGATRAADARKCTADLTKRTWRGVDGSMARLDQTRALVRLQPGSANVNSALSKPPFVFARLTHSGP